MLNFDSTDKKCIIIEHMDDNNQILDINSFVNYWMDQLGNNDQYKDLPKDDVLRIQNNSKSFLDMFLQSTPQLTNISAEAVKPLLDFLRIMRKQHEQKGLSIRDTTLLTLSLKTSLNDYLKVHPNHDYLFENLNHLLDVFGILSFELYSHEQEKLIGKQAEQINYLQGSESKAYGRLIGTSPAMKTVYQAIGLVLENDVSVLLQGESGTGKDVIANVIHANSTRKSAPFVAVNCGAIPTNLIESELFGHEQGAFTGADKRRIGKFELADQGTLFLDEISELSLDNQTKLLRVLQNKEIQRIGGDQTIPINVRIIAASNKDLETLIDQQLFRLDLFYRINVFPIVVPSLNERGHDIILLAKYFIERFTHSMKLPSCDISDDGIRYLLQYNWKGNVRELENIIQRGMIIANGKPLTQALLSFMPGQVISTPLLPEGTLSSKVSEDAFVPKTFDEHEEAIIRNTLNFCNNNVKQTAQILNVSRTTLYNKFKKFNIDV